MPGARTGRPGYRTTREEAAGLDVAGNIVQGGQEMVPGDRLIGLSLETQDAKVTLQVADDGPGGALNQMVGNNNKADRPNHSMLQAKDVRHFAFRTTMQLRQIAQDIGINPVEVLLWMSAGLAPKFQAVPDPTTGRLRLVPVVGENGYQSMETLDTTAQMIAAKEASKYLYPQLKAIDLGAQLTEGTVGDEKVNQAMSTFMGLARAVLGTGQNAKVVAVEEPGEGSDDDDDRERP